MKKFWIDNKDKIMTFIICGTIFYRNAINYCISKWHYNEAIGLSNMSLLVVLYCFFIIATIMSFPLNLVAEHYQKRYMNLKGLVNHMRLSCI